MAAPTATQGSFGQKLSAALTARGMGAKTLAKAISRQHGGSVEDRRRAIIRWLQGSTPVQHNRHLVEDVLGLERDSLKDDEDDEEDSALMRDVSLEDVLRLHIRRLLRDEQARVV